MRVLLRMDVAAYTRRRRTHGVCLIPTTFHVPIARMFGTHAQVQRVSHTLLCTALTE
jgi:hypothetical protein